jgi:hypothetical protein
MDISKLRQNPFLLASMILHFSHRFSFVTKLKTPPLPSLFPGYQFCTVEYLISASRPFQLLRHAAGFRHDSVVQLQGNLRNSFICISKVLSNCPVPWLILK